MPITKNSQGRHHSRTLDIVGGQPGGGPRALVDVVVTEAYKSSASMHTAGHAVGGAEQRKLRHYSDYPRSDHLLPAATDTSGCMGPRFHTLLQNIASLAYARPPSYHFFFVAVDVHGALGFQWLDLLARLARRVVSVSRRRGEPADFNAAGSWAQARDPATLPVAAGRCTPRKAMKQVKPFCAKGSVYVNGEWDKFVSHGVIRAEAMDRSSVEARSLLPEMNATNVGGRAFT
eukprot:SM000030S11313  [mRNA]  locus=s30:37537:53021:- [translate_table: standard]